MTDKKNGLASKGGVTPMGKHKNAIGGDVRKPANKGVSANPGFLGASADNSLPPINETIFKMLIAEAEERVGRLLKKGKKKEEALEEVAADMELTMDEASALKKRVEEEEPTAPQADLDLQPVGDITSANDCIYFESSEEADQAAGILMYKSIPWKQKDNNAGRPYIQFENKTMMDKAHDALKRRWDFIESSDRKVAVVEFDNLTDYDKVLDFMNKQGMLLDFNAASGDLSEDAVEAAKKSKADKKGRIPKNINEDEVTSAQNSYKAINKSKRDDAGNVNPWDDRNKRIVKVRKRWR